MERPSGPTAPELLSRSEHVRAWALRRPRGTLSRRSHGYVSARPEWAADCFSCDWIFLTFLVFIYTHRQSRTKIGKNPISSLILGNYLKSNCY